MPIAKCPVKGFEDVTITYPDEWLMKHIDQFYVGLSKAPENSAPSTKEIYGSIALCDTIDGIDLTNVSEAPIAYRDFFIWLVNEVYVTSYVEAITVPNES